MARQKTIELGLYIGSQIMVDRSVTAICASLRIPRQRGYRALWAAYPQRGWPMPDPQRFAAQEVDPLLM